jgi:hypothetical protein
MFFGQLEMFDVCTVGESAHVYTIFKFLPHMPKGTDHCSSEEHRCNPIDAGGKNVNIVSICAVSPIEHL